MRVTQVQAEWTITGTASRFKPRLLLRWAFYHWETTLVPVITNPVKQPVKIESFLKQIHFEYHEIFAFVFVNSHIMEQYCYC